MYRKISRCRICGNHDLESILDLGFQKLTGVFPQAGQEVNEAPLELVKCISDGENESCGLVQLRYSCDASEMYGMNYGYRSGLNQYMVDHLTKMTTFIDSYIELNDGDIVLDVGSNDGTLLNSYSNRNLDFIGMDPTGVKFKKYYKEDIQLVEDFFSADNFKNIRGEKKAKVVTSISMFYDLEDPQIFVNDISDILDDNGIWILEQSYLPMMVEAISYDTICQEHLEYYCLAQIKWLVERANLKVIDVYTNDVNGGSFQLIVAKENSDYEVSEHVDQMEKFEKDNKFDSMIPFLEFKNKIDAHKQQLLDFLREEKQKGKVILGYGASTKGNVLLQYCGITPDELQAIAEVNEDKFGCVTPGTNIPIISEKQAREMNPDYFVVLPWHFKNFILKKEEKYMKDTGCKFVFPLPGFEIY